MDAEYQSLDPVTVVISEIVQPGRIKEYEEWVTGINKAANEFVGYLGVDIIRPRDSALYEYVIIIRFDTYLNLKTWQDSSVCLTWLEKSQDLVVREMRIQQANGFELWFTLPANISKKPKQPAYYKMVVVGILAVYPLVLISNALLSPFLEGLPYLLGLLISVTGISALMAYPVMPLLSRLLNFWLYPSSK